MFRDRGDAGRRLGARLGAQGWTDAVVVGLPRGGVSVAFEVAILLHAPLDVVVVRKLGVPWWPELAVGAVAENGVRVVDDAALRAEGVSADDLRAVERRERREVELRAGRLRSGRAALALAGRSVIVVDDGIATGSTACAACRVVRARGARHVVLAAPAGPSTAPPELSAAADEIWCLETAHGPFAVAQFYDDFTQVSDAEVARLLTLADERRPPPG
jgi:putative phosphoribosyl transferase